MDALLERVGEAFAVSGPAALAAALAWGVLSVALSPCHLASVPLVVAYMASGEDLPAPRRAFGIACAFAVGILVSIGGIGVATAVAGRMLGDVGWVGTWTVAGVLVVFGLGIVGVVPLPGGFTSQASAGRRGPVGAIVLGLLFGAALGPCTFAFMAPLLALVMRTARSDASHAAALVTAYGVGHAGVITLAGTFGNGAQRYLRWTGTSPTPKLLRAFAGTAVVLVGLYVLYSGS